MLENAVEWGSEYLILGQHFIGNEYPHGKYIGEGTNGEKELIANGTLRICDMLADSTGSNIDSNNGLLISNIPTINDTYNRGLENILLISLINI